jgi:hypothetical protein
MAVGLVGLAIPASAGAATQIGQTFSPTQNCGGVILLQSTSPGGQYTVQAPGVITSWSFQAAGFNTGIKFKVARRVSTNMFTIIGESDRKTPTAGILNTYTDIRVPVEAGDIIGAFYFAPNDCTRAVSPADGYVFHSLIGDVPPGSTVTAGGFGSNRQIDISATVEPDADNDGFGDETQDNCLGFSNAGQEDADADGIGDPCDDHVQPATTITKGAPPKTKRPTVTFTFTGTDTRAISGFQCKLDAGAFAPCTSPHTVRVKKGKHTFQVQAIDQAGNVDGSPATDTWKRKRKRKK